MSNITDKDVNILMSQTGLKKETAREVLIFTMAWMGTRDIVVALVLTASFMVLAEFLLNHKSNYCILPDKYKYLKVDTNQDGQISDSEINKAIETLEKARKQKEKERNSELLNYYHIKKKNYHIV